MSYLARRASHVVSYAHRTSNQQCGKGLPSFITLVPAWLVNTVPDYARRFAAALFLWLALVLWGSAAVGHFPLFALAATQGYRVLASALAPLVIVWAFWANNPRTALRVSVGLALSGFLILVFQP